MIDTSKTIEIGKSKWKSWFLVAVGIFMTAIGIWLFVTSLVKPEADLGEEIGTFFVALFFGLATFVSFRRYVFRSGPILTLSPGGLRDVRIAPETIPWLAIVSAQTWSYHGQKVLVLKVLPDVEKSLSMSRAQRFMQSGNRIVGANGLSIIAGPLDISFQELSRLIFAYRIAAEEKVT